MISRVEAAEGTSADVLTAADFNLTLRDLLDWMNREVSWEAALRTTGLSTEQLSYLYDEFGLAPKHSVNIVELFCINLFLYLCGNAALGVNKQGHWVYRAQRDKVLETCDTRVPAMTKALVHVCDDIPTEFRILINYVMSDILFSRGPKKLTACNKLIPLMSTRVRRPEYREVEELFIEERFSSRKTGIRLTRFALHLILDRMKIYARNEADFECIKKAILGSPTAREKTEKMGLFFLPEVENKTEKGGVLKRALGL